MKNKVMPLPKTDEYFKRSPNRLARETEDVLKHIHKATVAIDDVYNIHYTRLLYTLVFNRYHYKSKNTYLMVTL